MGPRSKRDWEGLFSGFFQVVQCFHIGISQCFAVDTEFIQTTVVVFHPRIWSATWQALLVATKNEFGGIFECQVTQWSTTFGRIILVFVSYTGRQIALVAIYVHGQLRGGCIVRANHVVPFVVTDFDAVFTTQFSPLLFPSCCIPVVHCELDAGRIVTGSTRFL